MIEHEVAEGDCLSSIAVAHGFFWTTLWNLPENSELKQRRKEPTILFPGDIVCIPELREKEESRGVEAKHRFRRKGVPGKLRLRLLKPDFSEETAEPPPPPDEDQLAVSYDDPQEETTPEEPWSDAPYQIEIDGIVTTGTTDGDGKLEISIPPGARSGTLLMEPGSERETSFPLQLGFLDPIDELTGVADRLNNLGYAAGCRPTELTSELSEALRAFQQANGLEIDGEPSQATRDKLKEVHGS